MRRRKGKCPLCGKPARPGDTWHPFCSKRCRTQDLANWATGEYSVPVPASEVDEQWDLPREADESRWDG